MIAKIIATHMNANRRLVVPEFGAFIRKEDGGDVAFVPFLKRDDGVLKDLVAAAIGVSEQDAALMIDEFVFSIRKGVSELGSYTIEGLGVITKDGNGVLTMRYDSSAMVASGCPLEEVLQEQDSLADDNQIVAEDNESSENIIEIEELPIAEESVAAPQSESNDESKGVSEKHIEQLYGGQAPTATKPISRRPLKRRPKQAKSTGSTLFITILAVAAIAFALFALAYAYGWLGECEIPSELIQK